MKQKHGFYWMLAGIGASLLMIQSPASAVDQVVVVPLGGGAVGNATAADVVKGKTFSSKEGKGLVGTMSSPYLDSGNGTIIDSATGLMWQQADDGDYSWDDAVAHCQTLHFPQTGGYDDWRLPTKDELKGLVRCSNVTETPLVEIC